ncbi:MAG: hypothetical protein ACLGHQ_02500, partial [Acidimicrobiia bacterium]
METEARKPPPNMFGEMAQMLLEKGLEQERAVLERYRANGRQVFEVPQRAEHETFAAWTERVASALHDGHDVIFQMPFV